MIASARYFASGFVLGLMLICPVSFPAGGSEEANQSPQASVPPDPNIPPPPLGTARHPAGGPASVSGRVRVSGKAPAEPLVIGLWYRTGGGLEHNLGYPNLRVRTDPDGFFRFEGLPSDWSGRLHLPAGFGFRDVGEYLPRNKLNLQKPETGLEIDLQRLPALVGRVVDSSRTRPVVNAHVGWKSSTKGRLVVSSVQWKATSDGEGRFEIRLDEDPDSLVVAVSNVDGTGTSYRQYAREDLLLNDAGIVDLGDLALIEVREILVLIHDADGNPVQEGVALTLEPAGEDWAEANGSGLASLPVRGEITHIAAGKPGYWPVRIAVPDSLDTPLSVTLTPENRLEVTVINQDGEPESGVTVGLESEDGNLFAIRDGNGGWIAVPKRISAFQFVERNPPPGQHFGMGPSLGGDRSVEAKTGPDAWVAIRRIWPGRPLRLYIRGHGIGTVLHSETIAPMGDAERRSILVQIEVPAEVTGVVLGPDGAPVEGALVSFQSGDESPDSHWGGGTTDENGRFSLKWFPVPLADVHIEHSAYAVKIEPEVRLPRDGSELRFSLSRPRVVLVHVVDATGQEIPGVCVGASDVETDEILAFCYDHEDAAVRVGGLPEGEVVLWANVPGARGDANVELRHDTSIPETKIVIPTQAKLIASWEMPRGQGIHAAFLVLSPTDGSLPLEYQLQEEGRRSGTIAVYAPPGEYEVHLKELSSRTNDRRLTEGTTATLSVGNTAGVTLTPIDAE